MRTIILRPFGDKIGRFLSTDNGGRLVPGCASCVQDPFIESLEVTRLSVDWALIVSQVYAELFQQAA